MSSDQYSLTLKSDLSELAKADELLQTLISKYNISEQVGDSVQLLLSEAVTNAILHGNKMDPKKNVLLDANVEGNKLEFSITDEGDGFKPEEVPDPLNEENLLKTSGRGLYLMREYADGVWYNEKGNQLKLTFKLG